jgi:hypothetical protein
VEQNDESVNTKEEPIESTNPFGNDEDEDDESNPFSDPTPPDRFGHKRCLTMADNFVSLL